MSPTSRSPAYRSSGWRPPLAPDSKGITHALILTRNSKTGLDELAEPEAMQTWLRERRLLAEETPIDEGLFQQVLAVRDGLRGLVLARHGAPLDVERLNTEIGALRFQIGAGAEAPELRTVGADAASVLVGGFVAALNEGNWTRFKLCANPECGWIFYDDSKYKSRRWCLLQRCGNPTHVRASRRRGRGF